MLKVITSAFELLKSLIGLLVIGFVLFAILRQSMKEDNKPTKPSALSCHEDWHLCKTNSEVANDFPGWVKAQVDCQYKTNERVKYGTPSWPFLSSFSTFLKGADYIRDGKATLIERDVQIQNMFGAMVHSQVTCRYDLNKNEVLDIEIEPAR